MVDQIGSVFKTTTASEAVKTQNAFDGSVDTFLKLFLAQLKNQDPTQPFSTESMTQQTAALTQTQQTIETNKNLEKLLAAQVNSQASSVTSFVNKNINFQSKELFAGASGAEFSFDVKQSANVKVQITNSSGELVYDSTGKMDAGKSTFVWDKVGNNGITNPEGKYNIRVSTQDSGGKYNEIPVSVKGLVSGVDFTNNGEPTLVIGSGVNKINVTLDKVAYVS
jgi:flagellar basal-body rod modification protein FlgD